MTSFCEHCQTELHKDTPGIYCDRCRRAWQASNYHYLPDQPAWLDDPTNPCKGKLGLFFPTDQERPPARDRRERAAARVCGLCAHRSACRDYARTHRLIGIWGGETDLQRAQAGRGSFALTGPALAARRTSQHQETA